MSLPSSRTSQIFAFDQRFVQVAASRICFAPGREVSPCVHALQFGVLARLASVFAMNEDAQLICCEEHLRRLPDASAHRESPRSQVTMALRSAAAPAEPLSEPAGVGEVNAGERIESELQMVACAFDHGCVSLLHFD
jgi:hypothetical protein